MTGRYANAAAFRAALESRLRQESEESGRDLQWLRRRLVFTRILARLSATAPQAWVLKGGMAVELRRPGLARATRDIDLVLRAGVVKDPADARQIQETLLESLLEDVDADGFVFRVHGGTRLQDDAYARPAWRFSVEATLAGRVFADRRRRSARGDHRDRAAGTARPARVRRHRTAPFRGDRHAPAVRREAARDDPRLRRRA